MSTLPPPPAPKPVQMPVMTEADKQRLCVSSPAMPSPMMGAPMMGTPMMGGCPSVGMGPNLVFNFNQHPGMYMVATPPPAAGGGGGGGGGGDGDKGDKGAEKKPAPPQLVQGDPTWCRPRMPVKKGEKMKADPCLIM